MPEDATLALNQQWFVDMLYAAAFLRTRPHLPIGQTRDLTLDPVFYGYKF